MKWPWISRKRHEAVTKLMADTLSLAIVDQAKLRSYQQHLVSEEVDEFKTVLQAIHDKTLEKLRAEVRGLRGDVNNLVDNITRVAVSGQQAKEEAKYIYRAEISISDYAAMGMRDTKSRDLMISRLLINVWKGMKDAHFVESASEPLMKRDPYDIPGLGIDSYHEG